jgi:hypothetical protein
LIYFLGITWTGIGAAVARAFVEAGCRRLVLTDINSEILEKTKKSLEQEYSRPDLQILALDGDISSDTFAEELVAKTIEQFGRLDYAVLLYLFIVSKSWIDLIDSVELGQLCWRYGQQPVFNRDLPRGLRQNQCRQLPRLLALIACRDQGNVETTTSS